MGGEARKEAQRWLRSNDEDEADDNVQHLLNTPVTDWFLTCGELCITNPIDKKDPSGYWREERHQDGGASVLHMGVTVFGRRRVVFEQGEGCNV